VTAAMRLQLAPVWVQQRVGSMRQPSRLPQESAPYLITLPADALLAAAPGSLAVLPRCDSATVSGTVTSRAMGLSRNHSIINVVPAGHLSSCCSKLTGSLTAGV